MSSSALLERGSSAVAPFSGPIQVFSLVARHAAVGQLVCAAALLRRVRKDIERLQDPLPL